MSPQSLATLQDKSEILCDDTFISVARNLSSSLIELTPLCLRTPENLSDIQKVIEDYNHYMTVFYDRVSSIKDSRNFVSNKESVLLSLFNSLEWSSDDTCFLMVSAHKAYDDCSVGYRSVDFAPFETLWRTRRPCLCGTTQISCSFRGTGVAREIYGWIDTLFPEITQIPHGYAGAPFSLSEDAQDFWKKRMRYKPLPLDSGGIIGTERPVPYIRKTAELTVDIEGFLQEDGDIYHDDDVFFKEHPRLIVRDSHSIQAISQNDVEKHYNITPSYSP